MKTLILIRHAKSDWPENTEDFDRPLAERGLKDAKNMAEFLKNSVLKIDKLMSSPAKRTLETAGFFSESYGIPVDSDTRLYHPSENNFLATIAETPDSVETMAVFSHNNGISNFANYLSGEILHFPTCAVGIFEINTEKWMDFENAEKKMTEFFTPKKDLK